MFRILHLSDLHARVDHKWSTDALLNDAKRILLEESRQQNFDVLAFTGDIAYSGRKEEYEIAGQWMEDFCLATSGLNLDPKRLLFVSNERAESNSARGVSLLEVVQRVASTTRNDTSHGTAKTS